ncbi:MAG: GerAB/ArcD/ProY family transporter [Oscillospiraceae bacterium]|nr:GerAB/ArcD/ProY family transporter [Oscillospiraceae bacterium]
MKSKISLASGVCICVSFVTSNYIIYNTNTALLESDWTCLILGFILSITLFAIYSAIMIESQKLTFFELINGMFSPLFAKIILASYLGFALICAGYCLRALMDFCYFFFQGSIPFIILSLVFILLCIYTAEKGVSAIAKFAIIGAIISAGLIAFSVLLGVKDFDFSYLSLAIPSTSSLTQNSIKTALVPFGELIILTGVLHCHQKHSKPLRIFLRGGFIGALILLITSVRNLLLLGHGGLKTSQFPSYSALSVVGIADFLSNLELFALAVYIILCFTKICICLISAKNAISKMLNKSSGKKYVLPLGIAVLILSFILPKLQFNSAYLALCFALSFIIPLFILFAIKSQKKTAG